MTPAQEAQARRVELLSRHGYTCWACGDGDIPLEIHHRYYNSQAYYGDYPDESLEVLCGKCHIEADKLRRLLMKSIGKMSSDISTRALGYMEALVLADEWEHPLATIKVRGPEHAQGIGDVFALTEDAIWGLMDKETRLVTLGSLISASSLPFFVRTREELLKAGVL